MATTKKYTRGRDHGVFTSKGYLRGVGQVLYVYTGQINGGNVARGTLIPLVRGTYRIIPEGQPVTEWTEFRGSLADAADEAVSLSTPTRSPRGSRSIPVTERTRPDDVL